MDDFLSYPESSPEETDAIADNGSNLMETLFQIESVIDKIKEVADQTLYCEDEGRINDYPDNDVAFEDGRIEFARELLKMMEKS